MSGNRATRATGIDTEIPEYQFKKIDVDLKIGLALLAEHVYNIDCPAEDYFVPGFELLKGSEVASLLGIAPDKKGNDLIYNFKGFEYEACGCNCKNIEDITIAIKPNGCIVSGPINPKEISDAIFNASVKFLTAQLPPSKILHMQTNAIVAKLKEKINSVGAGLKAGIYRKKSEKYTNDDGIIEQEYVLVFAGSDNITSIEHFLTDWLNTNAMQGLGFFPTQYKIAVLLAAKLNKTGISFTTVGHSLGGGLASCAAVVAHKNAVVFNPAGLNTMGLSIYLNFESWKGLQKEITKSYNNIFDFKNQLLAKDLNYFKKLVSGDLTSLKDCLLDDILLKDFNEFKKTLTNDLEFFKHLLSNEIDSILELSEINKLYQDFKNIEKIFKNNLLTKDFEFLKELLFDNKLSADLTEIENILIKNWEMLRNLISKNYLSTEYEKYKSILSDDIDTLKYMRSKYDLYVDFPILKDLLFSEYKKVETILNNDVEKIKTILTSELLSSQIDPLKNCLLENMESIELLLSDNISAINKMLSKDKEILEDLLLQDPRAIDLSPIKNIFLNNIHETNQLLLQDLEKTKISINKNYTLLNNLSPQDILEEQLNEIKNIILNDYTLIENTFIHYKQLIQNLCSIDTYIQYLNILKDNIEKDLKIIKEIITKNIEELINKLKEKIFQISALLSHDIGMIFAIAKKYTGLLERILSGDFFTEQIDILKNTFTDVISIIKDTPDKLQKLKEIALSPNRIEGLFDEFKNKLNNNLNRLSEILSPNNLYAKLKSAKDFVLSEDFLKGTSIYKEYEAIKSKVDNLISNNPFSIVNKALQTQNVIKSRFAFVNAYCSNIDPLTNTQDKFPEIMADGMGSLGAFMGKTLTGFVSPITETVSNALRAAGRNVGLFTASILTKVVVPGTFGNKIPVDTSSLNLIKGNDGHSMTLLVDAFIYNIYTINNNENISYQWNRTRIIIKNQWTVKDDILNILYQMINDIYSMPLDGRVRKIEEDIKNKILGKGWEKPQKESKWNAIIESDKGKEIVENEIKAEKSKTKGQAQSNSTATGSTRAG